MNHLITAKQLTIRYFSIVAIFIIVVHYSVFELTTDDFEYRFAQNRLDNMNAYIQETIDYKEIENLDILEIDTQGKVAFDKRPQLVMNINQLPFIIPDLDQKPYNKAFEFVDEVNTQTYYLMKVHLNQSLQQDALIVIDNALYELSEEQLFSEHAKQVMITFILIISSLLIVIKISHKLTEPIQIFSNALSAKNIMHLNDIEFSKVIKTQELQEMIQAYSGYQAKIKSLIDKERAFNRYASHELRSPLMVMKGAMTLLNESNDRQFILKQMIRINKAIENMTEFVETLLTLTKPQKNEKDTKLLISHELLQNIVEDHTHLIMNKPVSWEIKANFEIALQIPRPVFRILVGNLIKNAFAYTDEGYVMIEVFERQLIILDTGKGFKPDQIAEGYGLGLLLVNDICRQFDYIFKLSPKNGQGTIASIKFGP